MAKNILITGAAGFIGFHVAQKLHARGDRVVGLDNFNDYYSPELKQARHAILDKQGIFVETGDICDLEGLLTLIDTHKITHLVHLAAQAGVRYSLQNPQAYVKSNLDGFLQILEACRKRPHLALTYASSSSVYGLNTSIPFSTEDRTDHPTSLYAATKKANELMAHSYHHLYGIPTTGLRFFTVYGPWGRPDMAYFSFTQAILEGKPIQVFNHGNMRRDFTYIDDVVDGVVAAVDLENSNEIKNEIFNLGNNRPEPLEALITAIEDAVGKKACRESVQMQSGDVLETYADISRSQEKIGFQPKISLSAGIPQFVAWYRKYKTYHS